MATNSDSIDRFLDEVFRDAKAKQGLLFFRKGERRKLRLRRDSDGRVEIWCVKREQWKKAKPEEVVRQLFLIYVQESLNYDLQRIKV